MAVVTIDGKQVEFSPGESVIQVATRSQVEVPYYCWHPRLSVAANCRMCLVEVEKAPKLVPACQTQCTDGMVVHTQNEKVKAAQKAVHEFLLVNHPIDCPICDQAGECKLQDYYMKYQLAPSRMGDVKVHKPRLQRLGPHVVYNAERCIVCTRCVRFMEEVAGERQLGVFHRGDHSVIGTFPGQELNSAYSLNTVDVCPVGALTSSVFRFKQRAWNLRRAEGVCGGCARGCNTHVDHRSGNVYRIVPRENEAVNKSWMCDEGRLTYARANEGRLEHVKVRGVEGSVGVSQAVEKTVSALLPGVKGKSAGACVLSLHATMEDAYAVGCFARDVMGLSGVYAMGYADGESDALLRVADKNPNRAGVVKVLQDLGLKVGTREELEKEAASGRLKWMCVVGHEFAQVEAFAGLLRSVESVVHMASAESAVSAVAHVTLPMPTTVQLEGTWLNVDGRAQRLVPAFTSVGDVRAVHGWLTECAQRLGSSSKWPSVAAVRAEMALRIKSLKGVNLGSVGATGTVLG
jgi:NADH-quinone oxidoreductase subunit G